MNYGEETSLIFCHLCSIIRSASAALLMREAAHQPLMQLISFISQQQQLPPSNPQPFMNIAQSVTNLASCAHERKQCWDTFTKSLLKEPLIPRIVLVALTKDIDPLINYQTEILLVELYHTPHALLYKASVFFCDVSAK